MIGKLKHSLKERCPECGKVLQIRVIDIKSMVEGIEFTTQKEYIACSNKNCDYERDVEQKRRRRQEEDLTL
jgi:ssDNA-binding Zn-finger/Zn-ribbon topoisomerase 1